MLRIDVFVLAFAISGSLRPLIGPGGLDTPSATAVAGSAAPAGDLPAGLAPADWSSIREACDASRHEVFRTERGLSARNPGQRWSTCFDGRGCTVQPDAGGWEWGLALESYGFAGAERTVLAPAAVHSAGTRVAYGWDEVLEEWYVNDARGLEHGFTVRERPATAGQARGLLCLTLALRGDLQPEVDADGRGARFRSAEGSLVLTYAGLTVFDAVGRQLDARLESDGRSLRIAVDERGAVYPLTIDPIAQQAYLKASNTGGAAPSFGDEFGHAVAMSGDTVVVGAYREDSSATGVNGDEANDDASDSGAAYVFVRSGTTWTQQAYLKASNTEAGDTFGWSVAVSGDIVVVGARGEDSAATGVNGDDEDNSSNLAGAAYVFERTGTTWSQQAYLKASNTSEADRFGSSVAVSGKTVVVGAPTRDVSYSSGGAAYVFARNETTWSEQAFLIASIPGEFDSFGGAVSVSGDTVAVGAPGEDSSATGVNGNEDNEEAPSSGAVYVFVRSGTTWSQQAYVKASNPGVVDRFGSSVAAWGNTVVVGAPDEDSSAKVVNGNQTSNSSTGAGAAYVFERNGTSWSQEAYLKASNADGSLIGGDPGDQFGSSVALWEDTIVVGAWSEDSSAGGPNGNQVSNSSREAGAAYVFQRSSGIWSQRSYLKASNTGAGDQLGFSVAVSGNTVVAGAPGEDSAATGSNGDQSNNAAQSSGAVYVFEVNAQAAVTFRNAGTNPASYAADPIVLGSALTATVDNNLAGQITSLLFAFNTPFSFTFGSGQTLLCFDGQSVGELFTGSGLSPNSSSAGVDSYLLVFPNDPGLIGVSLSSQAIQFGNPPFVLSNAQDFTIGGF